MNQVEAGPYEL
jgi:hypothetical protein